MNIHSDTKFTKGQLGAIRSTSCKDATDDEFKSFIERCQSTGLNPLDNQIHFIKGNGNPIIIVSIDGFRAVAEKTGKYAGNEDYVFDGKRNQREMLDEKKFFPTTATATIYKMVEGNICKFSATAGWTEYNGGGRMWKKMPFLMLGKCAEALALRKAFPSVLGGVYSSEEMEQADRPKVDMREEPKQVPKPEKPKEKRFPDDWTEKELMTAIEKQIAGLDENQQGSFENVFLPKFLKDEKVAGMQGLPKDGMVRLGKHIKEYYNLQKEGAK